MLANNKSKSAKDREYVVFVSPTKALVNQVAADVYRTYGPVFGILTREYTQVIARPKTTHLPATHTAACAHAHVRIHT